MGFANGEAADGVAWKIQVEKLTRTFATQISKRRALHNTELPLAEISVAPRAFLKMDARALRPLRRALERDFRFVAGRGCFDALIEDHGNVRTKAELDLRGFFRCEEMLRAVKMGTEAHALIGNFSQFGKAENLIAAGIHEDGARPRHETMKPAKFAHEFVAGTQIEMIGVGEDDFCAELFECFLRQGFDGSLRAHRHEERCLDGAVGRAQASAACTRRIGLRNFKRKIHLRLNARKQERRECLSHLSVSGEDKRPTHAANHIDSPNAEGNGERLGALQFSRVYSRETNGDENQSPKREKIERLAKRYQPLRRFLRKQSAQIGGHGVLGGGRISQNKEQNQQEERSN